VHPRVVRRQGTVTAPGRDSPSHARSTGVDSGASAGTRDTSGCGTTPRSTNELTVRPAGPTNSASELRPRAPPLEPHVLVVRLEPRRTPLSLYERGLRQRLRTSAAARPGDDDDGSVLIGPAAATHMRRKRLQLSYPPSRVRERVDHPACGSRSAAGRIGSGAAGVAARLVPSLEQLPFMPSEKPARDKTNYCGGCGAAVALHHGPSCAIIVLK
jgi:hypothetical protein